MVYATRGLVDSLLRQAADREPDQVTIPLAATPAGDLYDGWRDEDGVTEPAGAGAGRAGQGKSGEEPTGAVQPPTDPDLTPETPVFTHFYMPNSGGSVSAVFGVDLGTPAGQTQGRFVSHPTGRLRLEKTDDFHALIFVAVPPWERDSLAVFDRTGTRQDLTVLDVEPPEETPSV